jgi:plastocyanin
MRSRRVAQIGRHSLLTLLVILSFAPLMPVSAQEEAAGVPQIVNIVDSDFEPQVVMIEVNGTVSWVHTGSANHDVTGIDNESINSPRNMQSGQTYQVKFTEPGVYDYYCTIHSTGRGKGMWGRVIVVDEMLALAGGPGGENPEHIGVRWLAHWVGIISFLAVFATLLIYYFVLKYGETVHATDHRDRKEK